MISKTIDYDVALKTARNHYNSWRRSRDRLLNEVWPAVNPSFQLQPGAKVFTIGSCFARNIERNLQKLGFHVPTLAFSVPREEALNNSILNKYTPAAIFQEIDWAKNIFVKGGDLTEADSADFLYECEDGSCIDTNLRRFVPVTRERFFQRRKDLYELAKEMFSADCTVMTLGLIEAWFDREKGLYIQQCPTGKNFAPKRDRFGFERLTYPQCHEFIQGSIDAIRAINPDAKFLITTSPVPLLRTFTEDDVLVANMQSKSVLRAVAGEVTASNKHVDYFPSYESVTLTKSWTVWRSDDLRHVSDAFVGKVAAHVAEVYCSAVGEAGKLFQQSYVSAKADGDEKALEFARQALEKAPENADLYKHLGELLFRQGELKEAEAQFEKAIGLRPRDAGLHYQLSDVLARQGRFEEAMRAARRSIELAPDNDEFHRHVGHLWFRKRKLGKALIQLALAGAQRRLRRTKRRQLKRFLRVSAPFAPKDEPAYLLDHLNRSPGIGGQSA